MSVKKEDLGKNMYKLTIEVSAEEFTKAYNASYQKNKGRIQLPGFRKGKAPLQLIEKAY
ncbi:MAG: trigger factor family protein, partial [Lachnospiraceae bacterium]|nr:trigger factor family protein [Lachnospiraceae bacterium]